MLVGVGECKGFRRIEELSFYDGIMHMSENKRNDY